MSTDPLQQESPRQGPDTRTETWNLRLDVPADLIPVPHAPAADGQAPSGAYTPPGTQTPPTTEPPPGKQPSSGAHWLWLAGAALLSALGTWMAENLMTGMKPFSGTYYLLVFTRSLFLTGFFICGLELMLSALQGLGVPTLTLNRVRRTLHGVRGKTGGSGSVLWLTLKSLLGQPQFIFTFLIGAGIGVATIAAPSPTPPSSDVTQRLEDLKSQLGKATEDIKQLDSRVLLLPARLDTVDGAIAALTARLSDGGSDGARGFEGRTMQRFNTLGRSVAALNERYRRLSADNATLSQGVVEISTRLDSTQHVIADIKTRIEQDTGRLETLQGSLNGVTESVNFVSQVVGKPLPRHPWDSSSTEPTLATEIYRLVQHEDTLDKRISRLVAHDDLRKVIERPWGEVQKARP